MKKEILAKLSDLRSMIEMGIEEAEEKVTAVGELERLRRIVRTITKAYENTIEPYPIKVRQVMAISEDLPRVGRIVESACEIDALIEMGGSMSKIKPLVEKIRKDSRVIDFQSWPHGSSIQNAEQFAREVGAALGKRELH